jgi:hypothetical protein
MGDFFNKEESIFQEKKSEISNNFYLDNFIVKRN